MRLAFVMEYESGRFSQLGVFGGGHLDYRVSVCSRNVKVGCFCRREALGDLDCKVDVCSWNVRVFLFTEVIVGRCGILGFRVSVCSWNMRVGVFSPNGIWGGG